MRRAAAFALLASLSSTAIAEPCAPRVDLTGDAAAVARVALELKRLGVTLGDGPSGCSVAAVVAPTSNGLAIAVHGERRSEDRTVGDPAVAAAWIDSWLRDEIEVASWTSPVASWSQPVAIESAAPSMSTPLVATTPLERFGLSIALERSWTDDKTTWNGFDVSACAGVGIVCLGGRVRAGFQDDLVVSASAADRSDITALATAAIPLSLGQITLAPELGVGVGRVRTQRVEACSEPIVMPPPNTPDDPACDPMTDPTCPSSPGFDPNACLDASGQATGGTYVGDNYDERTYLPRVAASVRLAFPIARHVWLDAIAAYTYSPFTPTPLDDTMVNSYTAMPLAPTSSYHLGIGIRVGAP